MRDVVGAAHNRFVAYFEVLGSDDDSALSEFCDFFAKMLDVNDHTVSHDVDFVLAQNCRRQKIEHEFAFVVDDGVSCVVAALIAHHDVLFSESKSTILPLPSSPQLIPTIDVSILIPLKFNPYYISSVRR